MLPHIVWAHLTLISHCSGNTEGKVFAAWRQCRHLHILSFSVLPPSIYFFFIILPMASLWVNCHCTAPAPSGTGGGGKEVEEVGWSQVEGIMTEWDKRAQSGEAWENKVTLIRSRQQHCTHKAVLKPNLVFGVSLSDMSVISRHRSQCGPRRSNLKTRPCTSLRRHGKTTSPVPSASFL